MGRSTPAFLASRVPRLRAAWGARDLTIVIRAAPIARNACGMVNRGQKASPEQVMGTCLRLELEAAALYRRFKEAASSPELQAVWANMAADEMRHATLIDGLAMRRDFAPPEITRDVLAAVAERVEGVRREADHGLLDDDRMLSIAAALEFSEMDDLFAVICQTAGVEPDRGRGDHLAPLVHAVTSRESSGNVLPHLLAAMIRLHRRVGLGTPDLAGGTGAPSLR